MKKDANNIFNQFIQEVVDLLGKETLSSKEKSIYEMILTRCENHKKEPSFKRIFSSVTRTIDATRITQNLLNIINKYYGDKYLMHLPVFVRECKIYSYLLILSLNIEELKLLLLKQRDYELVSKVGMDVIYGQEEIEKKFKLLFGNNITSLNKDETLLSLMRIDNKDLFMESFNNFESVIFQFLVKNKLNKSDFYKDLNKHIFWDYEDFYPYIPITFFLSIPYSLLYEAILLGKDPMKKAIIVSRIPHCSVQTTDTTPHSSRVSLAKRNAP